MLLGYREYELFDAEEGRAIRAVPGAGWGSSPTSRGRPSRMPRRSTTLAPDIRRRIEDGDLLVFSKTNAYSGVHRRARMDYIGVRRVNPEGEIVGEARLIGLFTSKAYMESATATPLLHHKLEQILDGRGPDPRFARLQGGRRALRVVPDGRAVPGVDARSCGTWWWGCCSSRSTGGSACWSAGTSTVAACSIVVALPRDRFNADAAQAAAAAVRPDVQRLDGRLPPGARARPRARRSSSRCTSTRACRSPRCRTRSSRRASSSSRARGTTTCTTRSSSGSGPSAGSLLAEKYAGRFPSYYKAGDEWGLIVDDVLALEELRVESRRVRGRDRQREQGRAAHAGEALQDRWQGRPVGLHADPRGAGAPRGRGDPDRAPRRGQGLHPRLRRAGRAGRGARAGLGRRPRPRRDRGGLAGRGRIGLAEPPRDLRRADLAADQILRGATASTGMRVSSQFTEEYQQRRLRGEPAHRRRGSCTCSRRSSILGTRRPTSRSTRSAAQIHARSAVGGLARPGPDPARDARHDRCHRPDERLPAVATT